MAAWPWGSTPGVATARTGPAAGAAPDSEVASVGGFAAILAGLGAALAEGAVTLADLVGFEDLAADLAGFGAALVAIVTLPFRWREILAL